MSSSNSVGSDSEGSVSVDRGDDEGEGVWTSVGRYFAESGSSCGSVERGSVGSVSSWSSEGSSFCCSTSSGEGVDQGGSDHVAVAHSVHDHNVSGGYRTDGAFGCTSDGRKTQTVSSTVWRTGGSEHASGSGTTGSVRDVGSSSTRDV